MSLSIIASGNRNSVSGSYQFPVSFGRSADSDVQLNDRWVSRQHCIIELLDGNVVLRDLNSTHGTLVNREPVSAVILRPGDEIGIGLNVLTVDWDRASIGSDSNSDLRVPVGVA